MREQGMHVRARERGGKGVRGRFVRGTSFATRESRDAFDHLRRCSAACTRGSCLTGSHLAMKSHLGPVPFLILLSAHVVSQTVIGWAPVTSGSPPARNSHGLAFDEAGAVGVLFGGWSTDPNTPLDQTWVWDGSRGVWQPQSPATVPAARLTPLMVYDRSRGHVVLYGGFTRAPNTFNDMWEWNGSNWLPISPDTSPPHTAPPSRSSAALVWENNRAILFGGHVAPNTVFDDTWEWDGTGWRQLSPTNRPAARADYGMAYDPVRQRVVLYGGWVPWNSVWYHDTWEWDGNDWTQMSPVNSPGDLTAARMTYDPNLHGIVLFGGYTPSSTFVNDTWIWNGTNWTRAQTPCAPSNRQSVSFFDGVRHHTVVYGGLGASGSLDDTWELLATYQPGGFAAYGTSCVGSNPAGPIHGGSGMPDIGGQFTWTATAANPFAPGVLFVGVAQLGLGLGVIGIPECTLYTQIIMSLGVNADASGSVAVPIPVRCEPAWVGANLYSQMVFVDLAAPHTLPVSITNGLTTTVGGYR